MHVDNIAGQAAAFKHQQAQVANRTQEDAKDDEAVSEARSARAEEAARSDEPTRARQTAPSDNAVADAKRELIAFALKGGALDIRA